VSGAPFYDFVRYPHRAWASSAFESGRESGHGNVDANQPYQALGLAFASLVVLTENDRTLAFGTSADRASL
jgi:hypothetical protein